jgi:hypothetical protein
MSSNTSTELTRRLTKRIDGVKGVTKANNDQPTLPGPDPYDTHVSKRAWERSMQHWRHRLKANSQTRLPTPPPPLHSPVVSTSASEQEDAQIYPTPALDQYWCLDHLGQWWYWWVPIVDSTPRLEETRMTPLEWLGGPETPEQ